MKCEHCGIDMPDMYYDCSKPCKSLVEGKMFCNNNCMEQYYLAKIEKLTKSENAWHEAWYQQREIIGRLGCHGCIGIQEGYDRNKSAMEVIKQLDNTDKILTQDECDCGCHDPNRILLHCMPCCDYCDICQVRVLNIQIHNNEYHPKKE